MNIGGVSGSQPYYTSGQVRSGSGSWIECKSVYEADPSAVIRKEEDGIVAKSHYTEEEALGNQYMKQYRDSLKIVDGKLVVNGDPRNALLGKVSGEELEQYRLKLEQEGIGIQEPKQNWQKACQKGLIREFPSMKTICEKVSLMPVLVIQRPGGYNKMTVIWRHGFGKIWRCLAVHQRR